MRSPENESQGVQYEVKLYHPREEGTHCVNAGRSTRFVVYVNPNDPRGIEPQIRTQVESRIHDFFNGDTCRKCGTLAHVSYSEKR